MRSQRRENGRLWARQRTWRHAGIGKDGDGDGRGGERGRCRCWERWPVLSALFPWRWNYNRPEGTERCSKFQPLPSSRRPPTMPADVFKSAQDRRRVPRRDADTPKGDGNYAREIEMKRNRGEISCAECRRCDHRLSLHSLPRSLSSPSSSSSSRPQTQD